MSKLKAALAAAAALIIGGASVAIGLRDAGVTEGLTCAQWSKAIKRLEDVQRKEHFFVAVQSGTDIPKAYGNRVLGDCAAGTCTMVPQGCESVDPDTGIDSNAITYTYRLGPLVNGWVVADVFAAPYVAKGWKLAADGEAGLRWYAGMGGLIDACKANFTGQQCLDLLSADQRCWGIDNDADGEWEAGEDFCRNGWFRTDASTPCPYATVTHKLPCTVYRGAGSEVRDANRTWTDAEFDEL